MKNKSIISLVSYGMYLIALCALSSLTCVQFIAGAGSETTNGIVGKVVGPEGTPVPSAVVHLIPSYYNYLRDPVNWVLTDTTDSLGAYTFSEIPGGRYNIQAQNTANGTRLFRGGIRVSERRDTLSVDVLQNPGTVQINFADHTDPPQGYVYFIGTLIGAPIAANTAYLHMDSVPAGSLPTLLFETLSGNSDSSRLVVDSVQVESGAISQVFTQGWSYSRKIYFNTTAAGAGIAGNVVNFPVLVRLNSSNFSFDQAKNDGSDIRFKKANNAPLVFEIARWDSVKHVAEVWVRIDTVYGNDSTNYILMRWGNLLASGISNAAEVFDTSSGFQGVWHMEGGGDTARDATKNRFNGISGGLTAPPSSTGAVGSAREFDGTSQFYSIPGSGSGRLNFGHLDLYTISAWVYVDNSAPSSYTLVSKGVSQYSVYIDQSMIWKFAYNFPTNTLFEILSGPGAKMYEWKHITCVRGYREEYFYENGVLVSNIGVLHKKPLPYNAAHSVTIGKDPALGDGYFSGKIDELHITNVMRSADWIRLAYMNQKNPDALVVFE